MQNDHPLIKVLAVRATTTFDETCVWTNGEHAAPHPEQKIALGASRTNLNMSTIKEEVPYQNKCTSVMYTLHW